MYIALGYKKNTMYKEKFSLVRQYTFTLLFHTKLELPVTHGTYREDMDNCINLNHTQIVIR